MMEFSSQYGSIVRLFCDSSFRCGGPSMVQIGENANTTHKIWITGVKPCGENTFQYLESAAGSALTHFRRKYKQPLQIPLYNEFCFSTSGADSILKIFSRHNLNSGLIKIQTPKQEVYYGTKGMILNKNFKPLILLVNQVVCGEREATIVKRQLLCSPEVFTDDKSVLNKALARKLIPYVLSNNVWQDRGWYSGYEIRVAASCSDKIEVIIDNCDDWITLPSKPKDPLNLNDDINSFIRNNIDDVLKQIENDARDTL